MIKVLILSSLIFLLHCSKDTLSPDYPVTGDSAYNLIGKGGYSVGKEIIETSDGGFLIVGTTNTMGARAQDIYLVKLDQTGHIQWQNTYGDGGNDHGHSVFQCSDNNYIVCGKIVQNGTDRAAIIKVAPGGDILWQKIIDMAQKVYRSVELTSVSTAYSIIQDHNNDYVITGYAIVADTSSESDNETKHTLFIKMDDQGESIEYRTFGEQNIQYMDPEYCRGFDIEQTLDGGYVITGFSSQGLRGPTSMLWKLTPNGTLEWERELVYWHTGIKVIPLQNGNYAVCDYVDCEGALYNVSLIITNYQGYIQIRKSVILDQEKTRPLSCTFCKTSDNHFVFAGEIGFKDSNKSSMYLLKTDLNGNVKTKVWGNNFRNGMFSIIETSDQRLAMTGYVVNEKRSYKNPIYYHVKNPKCKLQFLKTTLDSEIAAK
ncbi:MAG: hypothetical protein U5R06_19790 [candidate division KSB1 bacterium]|nr:hypothetical protein [candidate division KSB1 bacterium]